VKRVLVFLGVAVLVLTPSAVHAEDTRVSTGVGYGPFGDRGSPVVSLDSSTMVAATGTALRPFVFCSGGECDGTRPARIEIERAGAWVSWRSGSLSDLEESGRSLPSKGVVVVRSFMPVHEGLAERVSNTITITFLPATRVTTTGKALIKTRAAAWEFRPSAKAITLRLTPAAAGRRVMVRDSGVEGWPVIGQGRTNSRGQVSVKVDLTRITNLTVTVMPTKSRAGWEVLALPQTVQ
jgi:hypothetical protein